MTVERNKGKKKGGRRSFPTIFTISHKSTGNYFLHPSNFFSHPIKIFAENVFHKRCFP